jgi:hypothetical protein
VRGEEDVMETLGISNEEFQHILDVCRRIPTDESTSAGDLRQFLIAHLREESPQAAVRLGQLNSQQMEYLYQEILTSLRAGADSALWAL